MIIWTGWGILLVPIVLLSNLVFVFIWFEVFQLGDSNPFVANLAFLFAFSVSGLVSWYVGKALNGPSKDQVYINKQTGAEVKLRPRHAFFFIRIEHWAFILPVIGIIAYIGLSLNG